MPAPSEPALPPAAQPRERHVASLAPGEAGTSRAADRDTVEFLLTLARALHTSGTPAPTLEDLLGDVSRRLGLEAHFFSTPTSLHAAIGPLLDQRTFLLRVEPGLVNLGAMRELHSLAQAVGRGTLSPAAGSARIAEMAATPQRYRWHARVAAMAVVSATGAVFLKGGPREALVAAAAGVAIGLIGLAFSRLRRPDTQELVSAFAATAVVLGAVSLGFPVALPTALLAGIIVLLPGLSVTVAMSELASRHLASGTARLASSLTTLVMLALGVALATVIVTEAWAPPPVRLLSMSRIVSGPSWAPLLALAVAPLAFAVLLRGRTRDVPWILGASWLGYGGLVLGQELLGAVLGASFGAFAVGLASNAFERARLGPAQVPQVPGVLLLVPGSLGFRSITALLDQNYDSGLQAGLTMLLTAVALAAGLLVANVVLPANRHRK
jgi:uncharacterized membrane protein YjjP (DUF1212 family)